MGTDIHGYAELEVGPNDWRRLGTVPGDRNYLLFAALAGVRNGYGFAGCEIFEPLHPLAEGRGFPEGWHGIEGDYGDHSITHFTAQELYDYNWDQMVTQKGYVTVSSWKHMLWKRSHKEYGEDWEWAQPNEWCGGGSMEKSAIPMEEFDQEGEYEKNQYVRARWDVPLRLAANASFFSWVYHLERRAENEHGWDGDRNKIRFVIGFDS